jgi:hypothetical protein
VQAAEESADCWQAQAEEALLHIEQLKDIVAEGARWDTSWSKDGSAAAPANSHADVAAKSTSHRDEEAASAAEGGSCQLCAERASIIAGQTAKLAALELDLRAMQMEFSRCIQTSQQMGRAILPSLFAIDSRLQELTGQ